ncbi:MAG: hypothetical protein MI674_03905 [Cytophagales bacterium]|nr:hypothetical protein [Cytophagales bacterium]
MKPKRVNNQQENLFEPRISSIIDPKNPLKLLADQIDWTVFEKEFDSFYSKGQPPKPLRCPELQTQDFSSNNSISNYLLLNKLLTE